MSERKVADRPDPAKRRRLENFARPVVADLHAAMDGLARLFPFGHLMMATEPTNFLRMVAAEVVRLRAAAGEAPFPVASSPDSEGGA